MEVPNRLMVKVSNLKSNNTNFFIDQPIEHFR